jgi:hypothetical protein
MWIIGGDDLVTTVLLALVGAAVGMMIWFLHRKAITEGVRVSGRAGRRRQGGPRWQVNLDSDSRHRRDGGCAGTSMT